MLSLKPISDSPELGWSFSRYETFALCKRRYYYQYYGAKFDRSVETGLIWKLRDLKTAEIVTGEVVHDVFQTLLQRLQKTVREIDTFQLHQFIWNKTESSVRRTFFFEDYYKTEREVSKDDIYDKAKACVDNFLASERFRWLIGEASGHSADWIIEPPHFGQTVIDGVKAYAKFDFLHREPGQVFIFDWKTGKRGEKHEKQLRAYSAWASYHLSVAPENVRPVLAYLYPHYDEHECEFNEFHLVEFNALVRREAAEMKQYCDDEYLNIPKDKVEFPKIEFGKICLHCNFREICWGEKGEQT